MKIEDILKEISREDLKKLSRSDLIELFLGEQDLRLQLEKLKKEVEEERLLLGQKFVLIRSRLFGPSSEKLPPNKNDGGKKGKKKKREDYSKKLSERYPNAPIREEEILLETAPECNCCGHAMKDSGMVEESEYLTVIPKQYLIVRQKRHKYRCEKCHGEIQTAPGRGRIAPGSSYGDDLILDASLSKFCDLIPMERYAAMAARQGIMNLPPNSLIELTHHLANFVRSAYELLLKEIQEARVVQADETPHRMLEGDERKNWYLWGFSTTKTAFFAFHNTRSGEVSSELLKEAQCLILVSDVYSGYSRTVKDVNTYRKEIGKELMVSAYCNAHARRKFKEASNPFVKESKFYLDQYQEIYKLESDAKEKSLPERLAARQMMRPIFEQMKEQASVDLQGVSNRSILATALNYFLNNYDGLTYCLNNVEVPLDNNSQERLLRSPVIGRKTWYGTHSVQGAQTAAILFSLVESCKLNNINPREYFKELTYRIHQGDKPFTPSEYAQAKAPPHSTVP